jgi:hypothetical protein
MAICRNCGTSVGCGCQLREGLCGKCQSANTQPKPQPKK